MAFTGGFDPGSFKLNEIGRADVDLTKAQTTSLLSRLEQGDVQIAAQKEQFGETLAQRKEEFGKSLAQREKERIDRFAGTRTGTEIEEFGRADFDASLIDWSKVYANAQLGQKAALDLLDQFRVGGSFGAGLRQEATENIRGGVAADTATAVASGVGSRSAVRGISTLGGRELSKSFADIEDLRASKEVGAFSQFGQMVANLTNVFAARPSSGRDIQRIVTPTFGGA